jgi:hypothetical protein
VASRRPRRTPVDHLLLPMDKNHPLEKRGASQWICLPSNCCLQREMAQELNDTRTRGPGNIDVFGGSRVGFFELNLLEKGIGIGGQESRQAGGNLPASLAHILIGRVLVELVFGQGYVVTQGDNGPELVVARLL